MRERLVAIGAGVLLAASCLVAQSQERQTITPAPDFVSVFDTIGKPVVFAHTIPKRVTQGKVRAQPAKAGTVADFVLETATCLTKFVAVATAGKCRAVPIEKIAWAGTYWALKLDKKELNKLPYLPHKDLNTPCDGGEATGKHCYASKLARASVITSDKKTAAKAVDLVLERRLRLAAFVKVKLESIHLAIPVDAIDVQVVGDVTSQPKIILDVTAARLEATPKLGPKKTMQVTHLAFRERLYEFFDVSRPIYELPVAKPPKKP